MEWIFYAIIALAVVAVVIAIRERRRGVTMTYDDGPGPIRDPKRAGDVESERIRASDAAIQHSSDGTMF